MADKTTRLVLKVETSQVKKATGELNNLTAASNRAGSSAGSLNSGVLAAARSLLPLASAAGAAKLAVDGMNKAFTTVKEYQKLRAQLKTATGSIRDAQTAASELQQLATKMPYQIGEITTAFIKLKNLGLNPSERALMSYGNTAAAMGKDLDQLIEAVADAAVGEFERLKEFGIKASSQGDRVKFTFRGVTKEVGKNADEIQKYLLALGENEFGTGMADQMNTVTGALSNMSDRWFQFFTQFEPEVVQTIKLLGTLSSGAMSIAQLFADVFRAPGELLGGIVYGFDNMYKSTLEAERGASVLNHTLTAEEEKLRKVNEQLAIQSDWKKRVADLDKLVAASKEYEVGFLLGSGDLDNQVAGLEKRLESLREKESKISVMDPEWFKVLGEIASTEQRIADIKQSSADSFSAFQEAQTLRMLDQLSVQDQIQVVEALRAQKAAELAQIDTNTLQGKADYIAKVQEINALESEQKSIIDSQNASLAQKSSYRDAEITQLESIRESLYTEEEAIRASYDKRKQIILESTQVTEEEKQDLLGKLQAQESNDLHRAEQARWSTALSAFDDFQNNLLVLAKTKNKTLGKVFKAAAIANAIVKTYESATNAYASLSSIPYVGPALGAAAAAAAIAAGMANVQAIRSQSVGSYAGGGIITAPSAVGDGATANVNDGEVILNYRQQKNLLDKANSSGSGGVNIVVNNNNNSRVDVRQSEGVNGEKMIEIAVNAAVGRVNQEIITGGRTGQTMQRTFNLRRGVA